MELINVDGGNVGMQHAGGCGCSHLKDVEYKGCAHSVYNAIMAASHPTPYGFLKLEDLHASLVKGKTSVNAALRILEKRASDFKIIVDHMTELSVPGAKPIQFTASDRSGLIALIEIYRQEISEAITNR